MKKLLLTFAFGALALTGMKAADYTVYNNGVLNPDIEPYNWWGTTFDFTTPNPSGTGNVMMVEATQAPGTDSMGLNLERDTNTGILYNSIFHFDWYTEGTADLTVRLTGVKEYNYEFKATADNNGKWNSVSFSIPTQFPDLSKEWNYDEKDGEGYVFSIIMSNYSENFKIYFNNIYYSDVDENWTVPDDKVEIAPTTVPMPVVPADDVLSIFSSAYTAPTGFNIGYWGQSTISTLKTIDGREAYQLRNFNYLGWELNNDIDASDYDYLHVDIWPVDATGFAVTPVTREGTLKEKSVSVGGINVQEWNSYDLPVSNWSELDLSTVFQMKFDQGRNGELYLANVYFWKDNGGDDDNPSVPTPTPGTTYNGTTTGTYVQTMNETEGPVSYPYTLNYSVVYNENGSLTIKGEIVWDNVTGPVGFLHSTLYITVDNGPEMQAESNVAVTTAQSYQPGDVVTIMFNYPVALGNVKPEFSYTVGSSNNTTAVEDLASDSNLVDIYTLSGVKVASKVDYNTVKSALAPGLYIVNGRKVLVK